MTKNVKSRDNHVMAGDFNAKIGTAALESNIYKKQIGIYGKGKANSNCYRLIKLEKSQSYLQIIFSNTNNAIDQHRNRQWKSVKLKTYRGCHRIETRPIIYASKITRMLPSTTQNDTAECTQVTNTSWQRFFLNGNIVTLVSIDLA